MTHKRILCLDFDGVIHSYESGWQGAGIIPDGPVPNAIEFVVNAVEWFNVCIYSTRSSQDGGIQAMQHWLLEQVQATYAGWTLKDLIRFVYADIKWPTYKPSAFVTIDDRALTFTGTFPTPQELDAFKPWNK